MNKNTIVPPGVSGREPNFDVSLVNFDNIANELALLSLGDFEPLKFKIDTRKFMEEIKQFDNDWVDYLPRTDRPNNRKGLAITNLPGNNHTDNPSHAQASYASEKKLIDLHFKSKTDVFHACTSLHELIDYFDPVGRTFLIKCNVGGYFVPHRDSPCIPRDTFRIAVFLNNCSPLEYDWIIGTDTKLAIEEGRAYYINTRKTHRTISWTNNSIHLIMNVRFNNTNVAKCIAKLQHAS
jgi:hypothetical protein